MGAARMLRQRPPARWTRLVCDGQFRLTAGHLLPQADALFLAAPRAGQTTGVHILDLLSVALYKPHW